MLVDKVIKGLECCTKWDSCSDCPYQTPNEYDVSECTEQMHKDALALLLALLKTQEAVKPKSKTRHGSTPMVQHWCGNCMVMLHGKPKYCPNCGRKVKWDA